jgi:beta-glucanase (GH16 family)
MSAVRALGASALSLLMSASVLLVAGPGSAIDSAGEPAASTSARAAVTQQIDLMSMPQIVQHGGRVANPDDARAAFTATIKPIEVGRTVRLQVLRGSSWQTVATVRQNKQGRAQFAARASHNGKPLTYRARAVSFRGLPAVKSSRVSTERWLTPTWTDRFSGSSLSSVWTHRGQTYEPHSLRRCSKGSPKAVRVGGGAVRISVIRDRSKTTKCPALRRGEVAGHYAYRLNGHIGTEQGFSFKYGFAAARIKFQPLRGQHGSFWSQPVGGAFPGGTGHEIDIAEFFGGTYKRGGLYSFVYRYEGDDLVKSGNKVTDAFLHGPRDGWGKKYHVFSLQWTPRKLVFRIDGKETWRVGGRVSQVRQYLILSLLASDYELPLMEDRQLPQHMYVD